MEVMRAGQLWHVLKEEPGVFPEWTWNRTKQSKKQSRAAYRVAWGPARA